MPAIRTSRLARRVTAAVLLLTGLLVLTGCSAPGGGAGASASSTSSGDLIPLGELAPLPDPAAFAGPSTAAMPSESVEVLVQAAEPALPATVMSHDPGGDAPVTVADTSRILALDLAGSIAATVYALGLGDRLVGRDTSTTFPEAQGLPVVTSSGHSISAEAVMSLRPSVVLTDGTIGPRDVLRQLRDAGIPVIFVSNEPSFEGVAELAREVGAALGAPEAGTELAAILDAQIREKVEEIRRLVPTDPDRRVRMAFLYLRGSGGIYYLFGEESGVDVIIDALGGVDVAAEIGWSGMRPMTDEALVAANPDLLFVMSEGLRSVGGVDGLLAEKPAVALTTAGEHRRIVDMADGDVLSFGPRTPAVLDALARAVYAPRAG